MNPKTSPWYGLFISLIILGGTFSYAIITQPTVIGTIQPFEIKQFSTYAALSSYVTQGTESSYSFYGRNEAGAMIDAINTPLPAAEDSNIKNGGQSIDYSQTNIQVEGVDEPDVVKTDGTYLYIIANNEIIIVKAYPPDGAEILSQISIDEDVLIQNLFIHTNRIIIFAHSYNYPIYYEINNAKEESDSIDPWYSTPDTYVYIYNTTDIFTPTPEREIVVEGTYLAARMIKSYVYLITTQYTYGVINKDTEIIPRLLVDSKVQQIPLTDIYYVDIPEKSSTFTTVVSIDVTNLTSDILAEVYLLGNGNIVYVSKNNIYVTNPISWYDHTQLETLLNDLVMPLLPDSMTQEFELVEQLTLEDHQKNTITQWILQQYIEDLNEQQKQRLAEELVEQLERTIIHRISIKNGEISYESQGSVPGTILNQFSLSEYNNHLRVSTTVNGWMVQSYLTDFTQQNNVYVLDMDLKIFGSLTGLAPNEQIFSTRFIDDLCYLVTFEQIDPFFVIDLSSPATPQVLGELKIPGFSTYLHPYDDFHIIGIGRDEEKVKISLFDVTDLQNPIEIDSFQINNQAEEEWIWTQSSALYEHKAFLFSKPKNLLVIPVGTYQKESAYVFNITTKNGISLTGIINHDYQRDTEELETPEGIDYYYTNWGNSIKRSLFIENTLYTISDNMVKINDLTNLSLLTSLILY